ncbi:MAG TPA: hypothetical protein VG247_01135 [Pseudonocardiaceae bacterium]|nr:hypothetical protein [Pseudonocardiaceae bacterium]
MPTIPRAFTTDDRYDRDRASNGRSRYGSYLAIHRHLFLDEDVPTAQVDWFAFSAWEIATSPIMAPGYVHTHPRVISTEPHWDDDGRPALTVHLAAPWPLRVPDMLGPNVNTWECHYSGDQIVDWSQPWDNDRVSVFTTLTVRVPIPVDRLPAPRYRVDVPDIETAKHAVNVLCMTANRIVNGLCVALDNPRGGQ